MATINGTVGSDNYTALATADYYDMFTLSGGNDTVSAGGADDTIIGGGGDDVFDGGDGNDSIDGGLGADLLSGGTGNDTLNGGVDSSDDTINGGANANSMSGGNGNDIYTVDNVGDVVVESGTGGSDTVNASVDYTVTEVEYLNLTGTAVNGTGDAGTNHITGTNSLVSYNLNGAGGGDELIGNNGNDTLTGGTGNDSMAGGAGNDTYYVDSVSDRVKEFVGEGYLRSDETTIDAGGTDTVHITAVSAVSDYEMTAFVENAILDALGDVKITGNDIANTITGNALANTVDGGAGNDTITGGDGADSIEGGTGADSMDGGIGDDTIAVDDAGDTAVGGTAPIW